MIKKVDLGWREKVWFTPIWKYYFLQGHSIPAKFHLLSSKLFEFRICLWRERMKNCCSKWTVLQILSLYVEKNAIKSNNWVFSVETGLSILMIFGDLYLLLEAEVVDQILDLGTADDQEEGDLLSYAFAIDGFLLCISLCGLLGVYMKEKVQHRCLLVHFLGGSTFVLFSFFFLSIAGSVLASENESKMFEWLFDLLQAYSKAFVIILRQNWEMLQNRNHLINNFNSKLGDT